MVKRKDEFPKSGELIIGRVKNVNPYSAFVSLIEYPGKEGMIHVSEIAKKWVKDIRNWVKKGDTVVCLVLSVDKQKGHINLSLKKVRDDQKNRRLQSWKRDERGEKLLNLIAENNNLSLDEIYEKLGFEIQEKFKNLLEPFELSLRKGKESLEKRGISKKWIKEIAKTAEKNLTIKEVKVFKKINLKCFNSEGINILKESLKYIEDNYDINVRYISPPKYKLSLTTKEPKKGEKELEKAVEDLKTKIKNKKCTCEVIHEN